MTSRSRRRTARFLRGRWLTRTPLIVAVTLAVTAGIALAGLAYWALRHIITIGTQQAAPIGVGKIALALVAGIGGTVALVVGYRRQRDTEQGRFSQRFGVAATQLGDQDPAVRLAGAYAMAGAADDATPTANNANNANNASTSSAATSDSPTTPVTAPTTNSPFGVRISTRSRRGRVTIGGRGR